MESSKSWMWFVRGTMLVAWPILMWAAKTLLNVSEMQKLTGQLLEINIKRIDRLEGWRDKSDEDRIQWMRDRMRRNGNER